VVAVGCEHGAVLLCDTVSGLPLRSLHGHHGRVYAVGYGAGDRVLASGSSDGTVRLCRFEPGELDPHLSEIRQIAQDAPL
jgi:WD40 repeat protein